MSDTNTRENDGAHSNIAVILNRDRAFFYRTEQDGHTHSGVLVEGRDDLHAWADADVSSDGQAAGGMKKSVLADPGIVADDHLVSVIAFEDRVMSDVNVRAEADVFRVKHQSARLEYNVFADGAEACQRK